MRDYAKHQTRRSMQSRVGHVKVIPPGLLKCVALHCLQGDLLTQKDITHREIALRRKAPVRNYIARSIQFMNVHRLAASDAIAGSGVRTHDFKLVQSVPLLRLLWAQPGTKKSKAPLFNFCAVDRYRRRVADQANDEHQKAQCNGDIGRQFQLIKALLPAIALRRRPRRDGPGASPTSRRCRPASVQRTVSPAGVCAAAPRRRRIKGCGSRSAVQCGGRGRIHDVGHHADGGWWRR